MQRGCTAVCGAVTERVLLACPVSLGEDVLKRGFRCVFKNAHGLFGAEIGLGQAEFPAGHD